jgi:hypothetical protein
MSAQLVASFVTGPHEIGIRLGEAAAEEDRAGNAIPVTAIQQRLKALLGSGHPIAIDREK